MPRTRRQITSDAKAAARIIDAANAPIRVEQVRRQLRRVGIDISEKQARRSLDLAERLGLVSRVNRARWGRVDEAHPPVSGRRSRPDTVLEVAARLLELPASTDLNRAVRAVLRLATEQGVRPVVSQRTLPEAPALPATTPQAMRGNGVQHAVDPAIEVLFDSHA